mgnify:CR=1 FL=1
MFTRNYVIIEFPEKLIAAGFQFTSIDVNKYNK